MSLVKDCAALVSDLDSLFEAAAFGNLAIIEEYLPGEELTVTVMTQPLAGSYALARAKPLVLPPVRRLNHLEGIAPYHGVVAITRNSMALDPSTPYGSSVDNLVAACSAAYAHIGAFAPIRIDCRADTCGKYRSSMSTRSRTCRGCRPPGT